MQNIKALTFSEEEAFCFLQIYQTPLVIQLEIHWYWLTVNGFFFFCHYGLIIAEAAVLLRNCGIACTHLYVPALFLCPCEFILARLHTSEGHKSVLRVLGIEKLPVLTRTGRNGQKQIVETRKGHMRVQTVGRCWGQSKDVTLQSKPYCLYC